MKTSNYRYGHKPAKRRLRKVRAILAIALVVLGILAGLVYLDIKSRQAPVVEGETRTVPQASDGSSQKLIVDEPLFKLELPGDWRETGRRSTPEENSISWQATLEHQDNRFLTLYIDVIPADKPLNRLVPVTVQGNRLVPGSVSDNCATFTTGGSLNIREAVGLRPSPAKWQGVDFICNLSNVIDNVVGTGTPGGAVNATTVEGPKNGSHRYFFLYTDRNIQPKYSILYDVLRSFEAK